MKPKTRPPSGPPQQQQQEQPQGPGDVASAPPPGTGQPARRAPADAPTTAYEYPAGERGAPAAEHERQQRAVLSGPSRDDAARGEPRRSPTSLPDSDPQEDSMATPHPSPTPADLQQAPATLPEGPNVAPSLHEHEAAQGRTQDGADAAGGREERIRAAAYALAAGRGFAPGREVEDWLQAERQVDGSGDGAP
ncbi:DUF2934 domain-containing protein [Pseudorhodoferax aquiterrae]|uniref:DUF2934 domain-containing protein n=1 Tax=Pseudorhodoferax aquiterrae TaxID=747304 RepID=UPI00167971EA|nr:DUF2934 domain-containing protein [Pseudorhodoferax aquiterrae]